MYAGFESAFGVGRSRYAPARRSIAQRGTSWVAICQIAIRSNDPGRAGARAQRAPVRARDRGGELSESLAADLAAALDRSQVRLEDGARDEDLAAGLESLAAALEEDRGDAIAKKRRAALGETLRGIAARLR